MTEQCAVVVFKCKVIITWLYLWTNWDHIFQTNTIPIFESEYFPILSTNAETSTSQKYAMNWMAGFIFIFWTCPGCTLPLPDDCWTQAPTPSPHNTAKDKRYRWWMDSFWVASCIDSLLMKNWSAIYFSLCISIQSVE